jgi:hypothetical protein
VTITRKKKELNIMSLKEFEEVREKFVDAS